MADQPIRHILSVSVHTNTDLEHLLQVIGMDGISVQESAGGNRRLELALIEIAPSDPTLKLVIGQTDERITLLGVSEPQLESICERIRSEYNIAIETGAPQVLYLEAIRTEAEAEGKYIRQTDGAGNYGHCKIRLTPGERGSGFHFCNAIQDGKIPGQFIEPIQHGIQAAMQSGVLAGHPVADLTATLFDGSFHEADSNEMAFKIAAFTAFKEAARKALPLLLEPVMSIQIQVPEESVDRVIDDLTSRRGRIERVRRSSDYALIRAIIPLSETLASCDRGRTGYPMQFAGYEPAFFGDETGENDAGIPVAKPQFPALGARSASAPLTFEYD